MISLALPFLFALQSCDSTTNSDSDTPEPSSSSILSSATSSAASSSSAVAPEIDLPDTIYAQGNATLEYKLEREAKINRQGIGLDFVHESTGLDTAFMTTDRVFTWDLMFYNVMVYYRGPTGDSLSEGCPGFLLYNTGSDSVLATQVGKGLTFFESYNTILPAQIQSLHGDPQVDFTALHYGNASIQRDTLMNAYSTLVIGNSFRASVLSIPEGSTEQAEQPVFLVRTREGAYAKFMVKQFQGEGADKKKTVILWQVLQSTP